MGKKSRKNRSKQFPGGAKRGAPPPNPRPAQAPAQAMKTIAQQAPSGKPATPLLDSLPRAENTPLAGDDISRRVPREYRAQAPGRCQRQYLNSPDLNLWIKEWVKEVNLRSPFTTAGLHTVEVQIDWRLMSNSGVDEGIIRPVIGAGGWPLIPGSSIKGLFRRVCPATRLKRWCGSPCQGGSGELSPGLLRFHGAWPTNAGWQSGLLDVAHSQQNWQVINTNRGSRSAVSVVSLYKPCLQVGLSSTDPSLTSEEAGLGSTSDCCLVERCDHTRPGRGWQLARSIQCPALRYFSLKLTSITALTSFSIVSVSYRPPLPAELEPGAVT